MAWKPSAKLIHPDKRQRSSYILELYEIPNPAFGKIDKDEIIYFVMRKNNMMTFTTTVEVAGKTPEQIYDWILNLDNEKYKQWHPGHKEWKTIKRTSNEIGSIVYLDERFDHIRLKFTGEVIEAKLNSFLLYKLKSPIPIPGYLSLSFKPTKTGTKVIHEVGVGYEGLFGKIVDWFLRKFYLTRSFEKALEKHANEEFKNLEKLL